MGEKGIQKLGAKAADSQARLSLSEICHILFLRGNCSEWAFTDFPIWANDQLILDDSPDWIERPRFTYNIWMLLHKWALKDTDEAHGKPPIKQDLMVDEIATTIWKHFPKGVR